MQAFHKRHCGLQILDSVVVEEWTRVRRLYHRRRVKLLCLYESNWRTNVQAVTKTIEQRQKDLAKATVSRQMKGQRQRDLVHFRWRRNVATMGNLFQLPVD